MTVDLRQSVISSPEIVPNPLFQTLLRQGDGTDRIQKRRPRKLSQHPLHRESIWRKHPVRILARPYPSNPLILLSILEITIPHLV